MSSGSFVRIWRGITRKELADDYLAYLAETGLRDYSKTPGNRGVMILRRDQGENTEIVRDLSPLQPFELLDVEGNWAWGCLGLEGPVGYVRVGELEDAIL